MKTLPLLAFVAMLSASSVAAQGNGAILGPYAARCTSGNAPAILVNVVGVKQRTGALRLRTYGGATSTWFEKKGWITRVEIPTPASGPIRICMPASAPGTYAIDLRHDMNGNGETDRSDGGGASGDPKVTLLDFVFGRKPSPKVTAVAVGRGVTEITITAMYLKGGALRPVKPGAQ
ncbi:DUF2141 domain-containing protein [Sphingomonas jeddahensis]|uniref:DUF2141 domain-containing protein n=1 Tax=Sphingomonas jeddahensis TaxID=1915074 RepID=A0A1V2ESP6_9SPHN|nr:DUF2141 domain-containing protein [Sphingomonas jeddahensis]ONF95189.1 hypothetical protein SPHI_26080 [Sphingomonas jeddahensis]